MKSRTPLLTLLHRRPPARAFRLLAGAGLIAALAAAGCSADAIDGVSTTTTFAAGTGVHDVTVGDLPRSYVLHVPALRPVSQAGTLLSYPMIIVLHGSSSDGEDIRVVSNMDSVSEANRSIVVYPNAVRGAGGLYPTDWNAGDCCGEAGRENIDDLAFIAKIIADVSAQLPVNARRVYIAGFSDGGRMAYHVACKLAPQIAAIAVVSGSMRDDSCTPTKPVAVLAIHGTDDDEVPFDEASSSPLVSQPSGLSVDLPPESQFWIGANGCVNGARSTIASEVNLTAYTGCTQADVSFYLVDGGTHTWPVVDKSDPTNPDNQLAATAVIANFFKSHIRPQ